MRKVPKYGVFSGSYVPEFLFGLNVEIYFIVLNITILLQRKLTEKKVDTDTKQSNLCFDENIFNWP